MSLRLDDAGRASREEVARRARRLREAADREREGAARSRAIAKAECLDSIGLIRRARQLLFDRHGPVVATWAGEPGREPEPPRMVDRQIDHTELPAAIDHLFNITADLSSVVTLNGDAEIDRRLRRIVDQTEQVIKWLRVVVTGARDVRSGGADGEQDEGHPPGVICERCDSVIGVAESARHSGMGRWVHRDCRDPGGVEVIHVGESLRHASQAIDADLGSALANRDPGALSLSEASQALHRASIALDTTA